MTYPHQTPPQRTPPVQPGPDATPPRQSPPAQASQPLPAQPPVAVPQPPATGYTTPGPGYLVAPATYQGFSPVVPCGAPLAQFSDRLLARIIDSLIVMAAGLVFQVPLLIIMIMALEDALTSTTEPTLSGVLFPVLGVFAVVFVISILFSYLYEVELLLRTGQTIGKRVMNIRVIPVVATPLTRQMALKRWLADVVVAMFVPMYTWLDGLWQLVDKPLRQCLHDKFAETVVVKIDPGKSNT